ncbi:uncharacterized protein Eint_111835 [Encephalitozoon intestinalis ATCC 50506]|uniref:Uncharacterized protein n=1 Tax=Encephalitozoon intestinalis (strain ATCC 50506) TaxID=876142 RepID=W8PKM3_ENCIT|nr:uncharacterized protein Eint_111835 [Encephalitozoon intestinalis ATCC 50506]AHL30175.1 hypothetical protein Eint_111835 [Encephalitozoon intestinalis ATCC 50506]UTX46544.1 hypothetical protein GPK93_11g21560 [Encephalitozoon intestinalis]
MELKKLKKAAKLRNIDQMISLIEKIPSKNAADAEKFLSDFYNHEVSVANAVFELTSYSKIHKTKVKLPLKGCFTLIIPNPKERSAF